MGGRSDAVRVVVVDDHALTRRDLVRVLDAHAGLDVVGQAGDGQAAVALARQLRPDVVLMDVRMPVLDGLQAARRIREVDHARIVLFTSHCNSQYRLAAIEAGAAELLDKSATEQELVAAIVAAANDPAERTP